jgi:hypothetical protein
MILDKVDAEESLNAIRESQSRSASLYAYSHLSPYLLVAGILWLSADLSLRFGPRVVQLWAWPAAVVLAVPLFLGLAIVQSRRRPGDERFWRGLGGWVLSVTFLIGAFAIISPTGHEMHGLMGLVTGFAFSLIGLWAGWRLLATGIAIGVLTMIGHYVLGPGDNILFMGLVGGGGMILGAWWLRRV